MPKSNIIDFESYKNKKHIERENNKLITLSIPADAFKDSYISADSYDIKYGYHNHNIVDLGPLLEDIVIKIECAIYNFKKDK